MFHVGAPVSFIQYDVSDPAHPKKTGSLHLGGIVRRAAHPKKPSQPLNGAPQMVEISRDGKRIYFTNSLYSPWDAQFYPDGVKSWMVKVDADPKGGMKLDEKFFVEFDELRAHQVRLPRRRRLVGFLLLLGGRRMTHPEVGSAALGLMLLLGAYHGINPGMGWLFAVALGMQEQKGSAVMRSLLPHCVGPRSGNRSAWCWLQRFSEWRCRSRSHPLSGWVSCCWALGSIA